MTADLVARLESAADECAKDAPLLREAASALRSSGEAVLWVSPDDLANPYFVGINAAKEGHEAREKHYTLPLYLHPATPASAWRPIADWPAGVLNRDATIRTLTEHNAWRRGASAPQTDPVMLGKALDAAIAALSPTPPTSTKGG